MFVDGVRTSTLAMGLAFVLVGFVTRQPRYRALLAAAAWLLGFEAFDMAAGIVAAVVHSGNAGAAAGTLAGRWPLLAHDAAVWYLPGLTAVVLAARCGVRASRGWMALTAALWIAWWATGWHANGHTMGGFDPGAEALNEGVKTAWGLIYLWPLVRHHDPDVVAGAVDRSRHLDHDLRDARTGRGHRDHRLYDLLGDAHVSGRH